jgi:putative addiction module CopG family antidote
MEVQLSPDQEAFIRRAIEAGRFQNQAEAVQEAMLLWEERERRRIELLSATDLAEASLARGEGRIVHCEGDLEHLVEDIKRRGKQRLSAERDSR